MDVNVAMAELAYPRNGYNRTQNIAAGSWLNLDTSTRDVFPREVT